MYDKEAKAVTAKLVELKKMKHTVLVGIDGGGGAGKSTFAKMLSSLLPDCTVVEVDDFYKPVAKRVQITESVPIHSNFEHDRLKDEVLELLKNDKAAKFQIYSWKKDELLPEPEVIEPGGYVIIEGLGTLSSKFSGFFDYKIWLEAPEEIRRERGLGRDTQEWSEVWDNEYLPQDERYIKEQSPQDTADIIIKT